MDSAEFWTICAANGIILEPWQIQALERYAREAKWDKELLHSLKTLLLDLGLDATAGEGA
jgi:hypothetical protein